MARPAAISASERNPKPPGSPSFRAWAISASDRKPKPPGGLEGCDSCLSSLAIWGLSGFGHAVGVQKANERDGVANTSSWARHWVAAGGLASRALSRGWCLWRVPVVVVGCQDAGMGGETRAHEGVERLPVAVRDEADRVVRRPTVGELRGMVERIGPDGDAFLVMSRIPDQEHDFIQVMGFDDGDVYVVEYRAGSRKRHFQTRDEVDAEQVVAMFVGWACGADDWHERHRWSRLRWLRR